MRQSVLAVALFLAVAAPALACEMAGPNTHVGVVAVVDPAHQTFTITDAQTRRPLTFAAVPEMLQGLHVKDQVTVAYTTDGSRLRATSITKG